MPNADHNYSLFVEMLLKVRTLMTVYINLAFYRIDFHLF